MGTNETSGDYLAGELVLFGGLRCCYAEAASLHIRFTEGYNLSIKGIAKVPMKDCSVEPPDCSTDRPPISVEKVAVAKLPTKRGDFMIAGYRSLTSDEEFVVLYK